MKKRRIWGIGIFLCLLDQIAKYSILKQGSIPYIQNSGIAFGIEQNRVVILISNFIIIAILFNRIKRIKQKEELFSLLLILAGGISNVIDRIIRGYVLDFIDIGILNFPKFNFADCYIVIGVLLVLYLLIKKHFK